MACGILSLSLFIGIAMLLLLIMLLDDINELEIEGEGAGRANCAVEVKLFHHLQQPLFHRFSLALGGTQVSELAQEIDEILATFLSQHSFPLIFNKPEAMAQGQIGRGCGVGGHSRLGRRGGVGQGSIEQFRGKCAVRRLQAGAHCGGLYLTITE